MAELTQDNIRDIGLVVDASIQRLVPAIVKELVPGIVRQETQDIRDTLGVHGAMLENHSNILENHTKILDSHGNMLKTHSNMLGNQDMRLKSIQIDIRQMKQLAREQGVLYEDLNDRFTAVTELLDANLEVKDKVNNHGERLDQLEIHQKLLKRTVKEHSLQLKPKAA